MCGRKAGHSPLSVFLYAPEMKRKTSNFKKHVLSVVRRISRGQTLSYGEVARRAGFPDAARAVGSLMKANHDPSVPCHRVIRADGTAGEYNRGGPAKKRALLRREGAKLS